MAAHEISMESMQFGSASMSGAVLNVSTETMYLKAQDAETQLLSMKESFETMLNMVNSSVNYWQGEAGDAHRATFIASEKKAQEIFKRLQEHVTDLRTMAAGYEEAEKAAVSQIEMLSSDLIS